MWQYQNTDELYHSNMYKNINKNSEHELYHSDIYLGKDFSDGIKHWKYIKRIKMANGKWRYVYKDEKGDRLENEYQNAVRSASLATDKWSKSKKTGTYREPGTSTYSTTAKLGRDADEAWKKVRKANRKKKIHSITSTPRKVVESLIGTALEKIANRKKK